MSNKSHSAPNSSGKDSVSDTPLGKKSDLESPKQHKEESLAQLEMIKRMMERSTRFLHLSGLAGMLAGIFALISSYIVIVQFGFQPDTADYPYFLNNPAVNEWGIILLALVTVLLAMSGAVYLSTRRAKRHGEKLWTATTRNLLRYFLIPLLTGGLLILLLWEQGYIGLAAPLSLIFYGLALIHASHFSLSDIRYLGYIQLSVGLASVLVMDLSMYFWAFGFGLVHLCYGGDIYLRYEKEIL